MARLTEARVAAIQPPTKGQEEHPDDLVTGLRLRVGAGGRKAWIVRTRAGGKVVNKTIGSYPLMKLSVARDEARELLIGLAKGTRAPQQRTFGDLVDEWLEKVSRPNNKSTKLQQRRLEIHVLPQWKDRLLDTITRGDVRELIGGIEGDVNPNRVLVLTRTVFRYALSVDWIDNSPAEGITKPKVERSRERVLSMDEAVAVYRAANLLGYPFGGFVRMLFLTGQRRTEVASMRWRDIDLANATWAIPAAVNKSGRPHLVPLSPAAVQLLQAAPKLGEFVWSSDGETHVSGFAKAKARLDKYLVGEGRDLPPWVIHDIRRTVATHMVRLRVSETTVGRVLNHAVQGVTGKVYALHSYADEKRDALNLWAVDLERMVQGELV